MVGRLLFWSLVSLLPLGVIASIWYPYAAHFYIGSDTPSPEAVARSRNEPLPERIDELARQDAVIAAFGERIRDPIAAADQFLSGRVTLPGAPPHTFHRPFAPEDVEAAPPGYVLALYGLGAPWIYLKAFEQTRREMYLTAARDYILAWIDYEGRQWKPRGELWNDHASAEIAHVLIEFWRLYRQSTLYSPDAAQRILGYTVKVGRMLADPGLYTFRTNHGVMQNLELLQLRLAFPAIDAYHEFGRLARERLSSQLPHYVDEEGAILEHSAGYQAFGVELLGPILRDLSLLDLPIPVSWTERYRRSIAVYAALRRPDGTLPRWGDTGSSPDVRGPLVAITLGVPAPAPIRARSDWRPDSSDALLPIDGVAVWWRGFEQWPAPTELTQTFVTWSYFPPLGHKHPDELSVLVWARGRNWWTSEGYMVALPAGAKDGPGWDGSNAPHLLDEPFASPRHSRLLGFGSSPELTAVDVERQTLDGLRLRRQVIQVGSDRWIILDSFQDAKDRRIRTVWTTEPDVQVTAELAGQAYKLRLPSGQDELDVIFAGSAPIQPKVVHGSTVPLLGWLEANQTTTPTTAFVIEQPSQNTWSMNVAVLRRAGDSSPALVDQVRIIQWHDADHWQLAVPMPQHAGTIERNGVTLQADLDQRGAARVQLTPGPDPTDAVGEVLEAYAADVGKYGGPVRELWDYRVRMSEILLGLYAVQQAGLFLIAGRRKATVTLGTLSLPCWSAMACWLWYVYF